MVENKSPLHWFWSCVDRSQWPFCKWIMMKMTKSIDNRKLAQHLILSCIHFTHWIMVFLYFRNFPTINTDSMWKCYTLTDAQFFPRLHIVYTDTQNDCDCVRSNVAYNCAAFGKREWAYSTFIYNQLPLLALFWWWRFICCLFFHSPWLLFIRFALSRNESKWVDENIEKCHCLSKSTHTQCRTDKAVLFALFLGIRDNRQYIEFRKPSHTHIHTLREKWQHWIAYNAHL